METVKVNELKEKMTSEQLKAQIEADKKERQDNCAAKIEAVCEEFNCQIIPQVVISGNQIIPSLSVVSNN